MTGKELWGSILQKAMEGKLVPQRKEEGTAAELLKEIRKERAKLVKEGKLKKTKPLPAVREEEKPFHIPDSWEWVRLGDIVYNHGQKKPAEKFSYIDIGSIDNISQKLNDSEKIIMPEKTPSRARRIVKFGDILYATVRPYLHNMCIVDKMFSYPPIASTGFAVMATFEGVESKYLFYYLLTPAFDSYANSNKNAKGVAYPAINDKALYNALIPIPPLSEQHRIVEKLETLKPLVDAYGRATEELDELNRKFPGDLKKSLLQQAMEGKLVPQRKEEGTAAELLQEIRKEKAKLVKEGKLKKAKPLPAVSEEEKPIDIPDSWEWVRLGEVGDWGSGATPSRQHPEYYGGDIPWLKTGDLNDGYINEIPEYISQEGFKHSSVRLNPIGSILIAMYGATIGKLGILEIPATTNQACCACILYRGVDNQYLYYFLLSHRSAFLKQGAGGAQPNISKAKIINTIMPLPPLPEQHRIVEKLEFLLALCDKLQPKD